MAGTGVDKSSVSGLALIAQNEQKLLPRQNRQKKIQEEAKQKWNTFHAWKVGLSSVDEARSDVACCSKHFLQLLLAGIKIRSAKHHLVLSLAKPNTGWGGRNCRTTAVLFYSVFTPSVWFPAVGQELEWKGISPEWAVVAIGKHGLQHSSLVGGCCLPAPLWGPSCPGHRSQRQQQQKGCHPAWEFMWSPSSPPSRTEDYFYLLLGIEYSSTETSGSFFNACRNLSMWKKKKKLRIFFSRMSHALLLNHSGDL